MSDDHPGLPAEEFVDTYAKVPVTDSRTMYEGHVWNVVAQHIDLGAAGVVVRDFVDHPGAVAVLALRGEPGAEEVLVIRQYRHPVGAYEWEIPAGLLDIHGEPPHEAAARELWEEGDVRAGRIEHLIDYASSPGGSSEQLRVFLARDISIVPEGERFAREAEESDLQARWVLLDDVITAGLAGKVHNPTLLLAAFAAYVSRSQGWQSLRPADTPWDVHPAFASS